MDERITASPNKTCPKMSLATYCMVSCSTMRQTLHDISRYRVVCVLNRLLAQPLTRRQYARPALWSTAPQDPRYSSGVDEKQLCPVSFPANAHTLDVFVPQPPSAVKLVCPGRLRVQPIVRRGTSAVKYKSSNLLSRI